MELERRQISTDLPCDFILKKGNEAGEKPARIFLSLHGFDESASRIARHLDPVFSDPALAGNAWVISPNGLFPMPRRKEGGGWRIGYAWYFYDIESDEYLIGPEAGVSFLVGLLEGLGVSSVPTTVIGFSQGGYIAPFLAERCPQVDRTIGIGASYLVDEFQARKNCRMDSIHGALDDRVDPAQARSHHERLGAQGVSGDFLILPKTGHEINDEVRAVLRGFLR